jgi:hypothetical protein
MATLKTTVVDAISSLAAAVNPNDLVRKGEMDSALDGLAPASGVANAISKAHNAVTVPNTNESLDLSLSGQALTGEVRLPDATIDQAAESALSETFNGPIAEGATITLAKSNVSSVVVKLRLASDHSDLATGVADTDYVLDSTAGTILIMSGSNLVATALQEINVAYDCSEILDGSGLEIVASGLKALWGPGHHQISRGDHTHAYTHRPLTVANGSLTMTMTVSEIQSLSAEVRIADSSLLSGVDGLYVNTATISTKAAVDALDVRITALEEAAPPSGTPLFVSDTDSLDLSYNEETGELSGIVIVGSGLELTSGVPSIDWDSTDQRYPVTTVGTGDPNGVVTGNIGWRFFQTDAVDSQGNDIVKIWEKITNNSNTGWF